MGAVQGPAACWHTPERRRSGKALLLLLCSLPCRPADLSAVHPSQSTPYAAGKPSAAALGRRRWLQPGFLFTAVLLATAAAVAGVSTWGLVESINATNDTVTNFWGIVEDVAARVSKGLCSGCVG